MVYLLSHELEHAWQLDVMLGRSEAPGGASEREGFLTAYADYDPGDRDKYEENLLEVDALRRAEEVLTGYEEVRPRPTDD